MAVKTKANLMEVSLASYLLGVFSGFLLASVLIALAVSRCIKTGALLGDRYRISDCGYDLLGKEEESWLP